MINLKELIAVILAALLFGGVSSMDHQDEVNRQARSCNYVVDGNQYGYKDSSLCQ